MDKTTPLTAFFKEILILSHRPKFRAKVHFQRNVRMVTTDGYLIATSIIGYTLYN